MKSFEDTKIGLFNMFNKVEDIFVAKRADILNSNIIYKRNRLFKNVLTFIIKMSAKQGVLPQSVYN